MHIRNIKTLERKLAGTLLVLTAILGLLAPKPTLAQSDKQVWVQRFGTTYGSADMSRCLATDAAGNTIVAGESDEGGSSLVVIKYSATGQSLWTNRCSVAARSQADGVALDASGNVFVSGSSGSQFVLLAYSSLGVPLWTNRYDGTVGSSYTERPSAPAVDSSGNVFITGPHNLGPTVGFATLKYSGAGVPLWTNRFFTASSYKYLGMALAVDQAGSVVVRGRVNLIKYDASGATLWSVVCPPVGFNLDYKNSVVADGAGDFLLLGCTSDSGGFQNNLLYKYSSGGALLWTNRYPGYGQSLAVDSSNNVAVTGSFWPAGSYGMLGTIKYSAAGVPVWTNQYDLVNQMNLFCTAAADGNGDIFVSAYGSQSSIQTTFKYSAAGALLWMQQANISGADDEDYPRPHPALAIVPSGHALVTGYFFNEFTTDFMTRKYDSGGTLAWEVAHDGQVPDNDAANAVALDASGNIIVTGSARHDFTTIKYTPSGIPLWTNYYDGPAHSSDGGKAVAVAPNGTIFVTGGSYPGDYEDASPNNLTLAYSGDGVPLWTNSIDGFENPVAIATDHNSDVIVSGDQDRFWDEGGWVTVKYSGAGVPLWINRHSGEIIEDQGFVYGLAVDNQGDVIVVGDSVDDLAVIKYASSGTPLWTNFYRGTNVYAAAQAVTVATNGDIFVAGTDGDLVTIKYSALGLPLWTNHYVSPAMDGARAATLDGSGNLLVAGYTSGSVWTMVTIKYSNDGTALWTNTYPSSAPTAIGTDANGNVFVTGSSNQSMVTIVYSSAGIPLWTNRYDAPGGSSVAYDLAVTGVGEVVVVGPSSGDYATVKYSSGTSTVISLEEALDTVGLLSFTATNAAIWIGQTAVTHDGVDAAVSPTLTNGNSSAMFQTVVTGPGTLSFWWKVSSETNGDRLTLSVNGATRAQISGEVGWQARSISLSSGSQLLRFTYQKNASLSAGQDRAWVDQVQFGGPSLVVTCSTNKTVSCGSAWAFDPPGGITGCGGSNVTVQVFSTVTNNYTGACSYQATRTWQIIDACTNQTTCAQIVTIVDTNPPACTYALSLANAAFGSASSTGSVSVTTGSGCAWNIVNTNAWISILSAAPMTNSGTVVYQVAANPNPTARTANLFIANQPFTITQSGTSNAVITLEEALDTVGSLMWNTTNSQNWFGQTAVTHDGVDAAASPALDNNSLAAFQTSVTGPGTISYWWKVSSQTNSDQLTFTINGAVQAQISGEVGWQAGSFAVTAGSHLLRFVYQKDGNLSVGQDRGWVDQVWFTPDVISNCNITISPSNRTHTAAAQSDMVSVYVPDGCEWGIVNPNAWISFVPGGDGVSNYVQYTVTSNTSASSRSGTLTIGGQPFVVTQLGSTNGPCTYNVQPTNRVHSYGAASNAITLTTAAHCSWSVSNTNSWLSFPISSGTGSRAISYFVATNPSASSRTAIVAVANWWIFIRQSGVPGSTNGGTNCTITLSPNNRTHGFASSTGLVNVTRSSSNCTWGVNGTNSWIEILSTTSGPTSGTVVYAVATNPSATTRTGYINIGGQPFAVTQTGTPPPLSLTPVNLPPIEVTTIGHFSSSSNSLPGYTNGAQSGYLVRNYLIDQGHVSSGGSILPNVSVNWDTNAQFTLTVAAPPGMKFAVEVPADSRVGFAGFLWWESTGGGFSPGGTTTAHFADLEGTAPEFSSATSVLSDSHGFFGFSDLEGTTVTNRFSFTSLTLTGSVTAQFTGNGTENYVPHLGSTLQLYCATTSTNDPGQFVFIVPAGPLPLIQMTGVSPGSGVGLTVYGNAGRTHIVEVSTDTVTWTQIASGVMPSNGLMQVNDATKTLANTRFYRVVELP